MLESAGYRKVVIVLLGLVCAIQVLKLVNLYRNGVSHHSSIRDLEWKDVNFLHTTDTHGWYSGHLNQKTYNANWGDFVSFVTRMREKAKANGQDLLLVDSGDRHDGNGLSDITTPNGIKSTPIFIKQEYDILTTGNHELYVWENLKMEYEVIAKHFPENYVSSNVEFKLENGTFVPFGKRYRYFTTPNRNLRVLAFGFLFDFNRYNDGTRVIPIQEIVDQSHWFNETLHAHPAGEVDIIVVVAHVPVQREWPELFYLHNHLRKFYPDTLIQYFGGHSHIRDFTVFDNKSTGLQSGRYCETVGWNGVNTNVEAISNIRGRYLRSYIDFNVNSFLHHSKFDSKDDFDTQKGVEVTELIKKTRKSLNLNKPLGYVKENYFVDYVPLANHKNIFNLLSNKILPELIPESKNITTASERIIIINTGSIRYDLYKGSYTIDSMYIVSPFQNQWHKMTLPKSIAVQVATTLNAARYIVTDANGRKIDNRELAPPHQYLQSSDADVTKVSKRQQVFHYPVVLGEGDYLEIESRRSKKVKLSKGYVTYDDFGLDGDDTPHKAVVNFPIPNVIESRQLDKRTGDDTSIDLVFYDFITPNILWALEQLNYTVLASSEFYSSKYLGLIMNDFFKEK